MDEIDLKNAFYGLKGLSTNNVEVRSLLHTLNERVKETLEGNIRPSSLAIPCSMLYNMKFMDSIHVEVKQTVKLISTLIPLCKDTMDGKMIGNALYGADVS